MKKFITLAAAVFCLTATMMAQTPQQVTPECGDQVTLTATPVTGYHFVRWNDGTTNYTDNPLIITNVSADASFRAYFAINVYNYQFVNYDGTELDAGTIEHGQTPTYNGVYPPVKPATAEFSYSFDGWNPIIGAVTADNTVFTAQFTETRNKYTITFQNYDGTPLQSSQVEYGTIPAYNGETPTKPADAQYTYTFTGWDHIISAVTGDDIYIAQYSNATNTYTLTVDGTNGTTTGSGTFQYGTSQTITATPNDCYRFVKWSNDDPNATTTITINGNTTITAIFEKITYTIEVVSDNESQGTVSVGVTNP